MPTLSNDDLLRMVVSVFEPAPEDRALAILIDLPDERVADNADWAARRALAADWCRRLREGRDTLGLDRIDLVLYRNARSNNADLPPDGVVREPLDLPATAGALNGIGIPFEEIFGRYSILLAPTEFSATAPLKTAAKRFGFRAATMPGFNEAMIPALKLDYEEVARRCAVLKARLDASSGASLELEAAGTLHELYLDLRHRAATASGGRVTERGTAGNLPSGETYIVPYEGERPGDPSRSEGVLPLELDGELISYRIRGNRVVEVVGDGPQAAAERLAVEREPAYANLAELGLGVLASMGVKPVGEVLLDEKLGLHIAFGRSDHFGGSVGPADFSSPDRVVHIDRIYIPEVQPKIVVRAVDLSAGGTVEPLMRDGEYVYSF